MPDIRCGAGLASSAGTTRTPAQAGIGSPVKSDQSCGVVKFIDWTANVKAAPIIGAALGVSDMVRFRTSEPVRHALSDRSSNRWDFQHEPPRSVQHWTTAPHSRSMPRLSESRIMVMPLGSLKYPSPNSARAVF